MDFGELKGELGKELVKLRGNLRPARTCLSNTASTQESEDILATRGIDIR